MGTSMTIDWPGAPSVCENEIQSNVSAAAPGIKQCLYRALCIRNQCQTQIQGLRPTQRLRLTKIETQARKSGKQLKRDEKT